MCDCPRDGVNCPHCGRDLSALKPDHVNRCHIASVGE